MKIKSLNLISFGKFKSKEIKLKDGVNIIYGNNESGKSTIMAFIKAMLYGMSGRGNTLKNERRKYLPWDKSSIMGKMYLENNRGQNIIISRNFGRTAAQDNTLVLNEDSGEETEFSAEKELGVGEEAFMKTLYIPQMGGVISGEDDEISGKLINLTQSGDEDTSFYKAKGILESQIKYYKYKKGNGGLINELKEQILSLNEEMEKAEKTNRELFAAQSTQKKLSHELEEIKTRLVKNSESIKKVKKQMAFNKYQEETEKRDGILKEIGKLKDEISQLQLEVEKLRVFENEADEIIYATTENTDILKEQLSVHETASNKTLYVVLYVLGILAVLAGFFFKPSFIIATALILGGIAAQNTSKKAKLQYNNIKEKLERAEKTEKQKNDELLKFGCTSVKEYADKKSDYKTKSERLNAAMKNLETQIKNLEKQNEIVQNAKPAVGESNPEKTINLNLHKLEEEQTLLLERQKNLIKEEAEIRGLLSANLLGKKFPDEIYAEREAVLEKLHDAQRKHRALTTAERVLTDAFNELSQNYTPRLSSKASEYLSQITGGTHEKIIVDKKYNVTMENDLKQLGFFSSGTHEQVYLSIRLAIIDMIWSDKKPPLILDDVFVQYDDERCREALKLLLKLGVEKQIIIFSCRDLNIKGNVNEIYL